MNKAIVVLTLLLSLSFHARSQQKVTVYFPFNKYYLTDEAAVTLDSAVRANGNIDSVKIYAWCDAIGSILYNDTLAIQRATSVKNFLLAHSIPTHAFKEIKGYGKRAPVNNNSNDSLRGLNRRAEIFIFAHSVPHMDSVPVRYEEAPVKDENDLTLKFADSLRTKIEESKTGDKVRLSNLNFYGGMPILLTSSIPVLDTLVSILKTHTNIEIEIQGYVCCMPKGQDAPDLYYGGWELSVNRAKEIYNYLVNQGINPKRLSHKGYGSQPLVEEITEEDKTINRRVEIKILKK